MIHFYRQRLFNFYQRTCLSPHSANNSIKMCLLCFTLSLFLCSFTFTFLFNFFFVVVVQCGAVRLETCCKTLAFCYYTNLLKLRKLNPLDPFRTHAEATQLQRTVVGEIEIDSHSRRSSMLTIKPLAHSTTHFLVQSSSRNDENEAFKAPKTNKIFHFSRAAVTDTRNHNNKPASKQQLQMS